MSGTFKQMLNNHLDRVFVNTDKFADEVLFTREGSVQVLKGIFDKAAIMSDSGGQVDIQTTAPTLTMIESTLPSPVKRSDTFTIGTTVYIVKERLPDGHGLIVLILAEKKDA